MNSGQLEYRPFLDGLRAIAVLAVIAYHLDLAAAPGGFLGVDVFFVLSGYLITRLLLAEKEATGAIDFLSFYARRARRLLPALFLLLLFVLLAGRVVYMAGSEGVIARDSLASVLYVANWSFIANDQSYFESFADPSPLRHLWSLAIEEQFYLVWPLLILLLPTRRTLGVAMIIAIAAASMAALALLHDPADPSRAYYGTDTRIHEPLIGALAAILAVRHGAGLSAIRHATVPCLAAILAFMVWLPDDAAGYYRGLSTAFSLITALLIVGLEAPGRDPLRRVLSSRPAVWLGKISYGMYLWHWPIIVAVDATGPVSPAVRAVLVTGATIATAALSYHALERPVRHARQVLGRPFGPRRTLAAAALAVAAFAVPLALHTDLRSGEPAWASSDVRVSGQGEFRVALIGDSIAKSLVPGFRKLAAARNWSFVDGALGGCGIAGGFQLSGSGRPFAWSPRCQNAVPWVFDAIAAEHPAVVIWQSHTELNDLRDPTTGAALSQGSDHHDRLLWEGWEAAAARFPDIPIAIIEVLPAGPGRSSRCREQPNECADDGSDGKVAHLNRLLRKFVDTHPRMRFLPILDLVCPSGPPCPRVANGIQWRVDGYHYHQDAAAVLATAIAERLMLDRQP